MLESDSVSNAPIPPANSDHSLGKLLDLVQTRQVLESLSQVASVGLVLEDVSHAELLSVGTVKPAEANREHAPHVIPILDPAGDERFGLLRVVPTRALPADAIQLVELIAGSLAQVAAHERDARQRQAELMTVYNTSMMLAESRDLDTLLARTVRLVSDVMGVKGASVRLIDEERDELRFVAVHGLSQAYLSSAPLRLSRALIDQEAIRNGYEQVLDLRGDDRVQFPDVLAAEGIVSVLSVPMRYRGQAIGVLRAYTGEPRKFSPEDIRLVGAVASQSAAAIVNARLAEESAEAELLERQVLVAADVQHRMIPLHAPKNPSLELASQYTPCYELAGDLYDFIEHPNGQVAVIIADVAGKGVPASLIMATVRAYLRASSEHLDDLPEIVGRLNRMLCRDNRPGEFVSLFYGVFDGSAWPRRPPRPAEASLRPRRVGVRRPSGRRRQPGLWARTLYISGKDGTPSGRRNVSRPLLTRNGHRGNRV